MADPIETAPSGDQAPNRDATDEQLMARTRAGDRSAFAALVDRHRDALVAYLSRLAGSRERGEDLGQEAFLRAFRFAARYREEGHFKAYLYRIATNLARTEARSERRRRFFAPLLRLAESGDAEVSHDLLRDEAEAVVAKAISELPMRLREPVVLHEIEDWPYAEIARVLGCREGTVKSRIHRGRQALRRALEPYWQGDARCRARRTIPETQKATAAISTRD